MDCEKAGRTAEGEGERTRGRRRLSGLGSGVCQRERGVLHRRRACAGHAGWIAVEAIVRCGMRFGRANCGNSRGGWNRCERGDAGSRRGAKCCRRRHPGDAICGRPIRHGVVPAGIGPSAGSAGCISGVLACDDAGRIRVRVGLSSRRRASGTPRIVRRWGRRFPRHRTLCAPQPSRACAASRT